MATEVELSRELPAVAGAAFVLMGAALAGGARRHAAENLAWQRQWRLSAGQPPGEDGDGAALARAYRLAGAVFATAGVLLAAAAFGAGPLAGRLKTGELGRGGAAVGGLALALAGFVSAWSRAARVERAPSFLKDEPLAAAPARGAGERLAAACGWALSVLLSGYGLRLLKEALR